MRLFLAVKAKLYDYEKLKKDYKPFFKGKWVEEENLHATLYFFGERDDEKEIIEKIKTINFPKKRIFLKGEGSFGHPPKILFVKPQKDIYLKSHLQLEELFGKTGKKFILHVTLLRIKEVIKNGYGKKMEDLKKSKVGYLTKDIILFKSTLTQNGPIYTPIYSF